MKRQLLEIYESLLAEYGEQHWWPAESPFEMVIGAILTQNTAWTNVERAIAALRAADVLNVSGILGLTSGELQAYIRPAGFFRQKAERLQRIAAVIAERHAGEVKQFLSGPLDELRQGLLALNGIGPETADSILLYAGEHPTFVVDAYTTRIFSRLGLLHGQARYAEIRSLFMDHLRHEAALFNEYHALIVVLAKRCCRKRAPLCGACPLRRRCVSRTLGE